MKSLGTWFIYPVLLLMLMACGKENESGKNGVGVANPYGLPVLGNPYAIGQTPYSYQGVNIQQVMMANPCVNGYGGMPGMVNQQYSGQRIPIQVPLTGFKTVVAPGDIYVGVTSYGDVAVVSGQAVGQPPLFVGYLCPRSFTQQGTGQLVGVTVGANTQKCLFKPITAATVLFPGGASAEFRWLDGGNSQHMPFPPPICLHP